MAVIVDVQGLNGIFVSKEISILDLDDSEASPMTFMLEASYPWNELSAKQRSSNLWLQRNHHSIL